MTEIETTDVAEESKTFCPLHGCPLSKLLSCALIKRTLARLTDYILWGIISIVLLNLMLMHIPFSSMPNLPLPVLAFGFLYLMFWLYVVVEALLIARFKKTVGKALLGISITDSDGNALSFKASLYRAWLVFALGMGMFLPVISVLLPLYQLYRAKKKGSFVWDDKTPAKADVVSNSAISKFILIVFYAVIAWGTFSVVRLQNELSQLPDPQVFIVSYLQEIRPYLDSPTEDNAPLKPENIDKTLAGLRKAQQITADYQNAFLEMEDTFNKKIDDIKDSSSREVLRAAFTESKEQIMGFLFLQQMRISLFENVTDFFKRAEGQYTFENGQPVFKTEKLKQEYEQYMDQLASFFESVGMFDAPENDTDAVPAEKQIEEQETSETTEATEATETTKAETETK